MQVDAQTKKDFSCSICNLLLEDPIYLPCFCVTVCRKHLSDTTVKRGIIHCSFCDDRFVIKSFEFKENKHVKLIMEADAILTSEEKQSKANILDLIKKHQELHEKLTLEQNDFEAFSFDHFQEICRVIDLQREELKRTIDKMSDEMIKKSKKKQASFQQQRDQLATNESFNLEEQRKSLKDQFRNISLTSESIKHLKEEQEKQIDEMQHKIKQLNQMRDQVTSCNFTPNLDFDEKVFGSLKIDGNYLKNIVTCSEDTTIKIWDIESGECRKTLIEHEDTVNCIINLPNNQLASGCDDGSLKIWDLSSGVCLRTINADFAIFSLQLISEETIAIGTEDYQMEIWNINDGTCILTLIGHNECINGLALLQNKNLASGSDDLSIKIWNLTDGSCIQTLNGHDRGVECLHELQNGHLASGSWDKSIKIWNTTTGECLKTLIGHTGWVQGLDSTENSELISCSYDKTIKFWNIQTGDCLKTLSDNESEFRLVKYYPSGILFSGSTNGKIQFWDSNKGVCTKSIDANQDPILDLILV